ncbi:MAG: serine/threonine protein kinase [Lachnospiraceae bacterium]|nr:serine/threonine protein kinase [Lachnospiraceae bacterium]MBR5918237.1 serine/threonine protein kinase [Lachnospiraceae bacterium]
MIKKGDLIGRYRVEEETGSGGMSKVYKVKDMRVGTFLAMKEILIKDDSFLSAGYAEAFVLKNVNHPALPRIVDILRTENSYCVVMDFIDGCNLEEYVIKNGGFPESEVIKIGSTILDCLIFLHSKKILYRDLKPSNIMLTKNNEIKLIDFGISFSFDDNNLDYRASKCFAPPEQLLGKEAGVQGDIFSFGATLKYILKDEPSPGMICFLNRCLKNDPSERYKSAASALKALNRVRVVNETEVKRLKRIVQKNIFFFIMFLLSVTGILLCGKVRRTKAEYEMLIKDACESADSDIRKENLIKLTEKEPCSEWYLRLFDEMKNDYVFDHSESLEVEEMLDRDEEKIKPDDYSKICEALGRMYLFYYKDSEDENENYRRAAYWFDKVNENESDVYSRIGHFLSEIPSMILEGKDGGMYAKYYSDLSEIISDVSEKESVVRTEVYSLFADSVLLYGADFYREGISIREMRNTLNSLERILTEETGGREFEREKENILKRIKEAKGELDYVEEYFDTEH